MKILATSIFLILLIAVNARSSEFMSNFDILDSLSKKAANEIIIRLDYNRTDSMIVSFTQHPASWLIEQHLLNKGKDAGKRFFTHHKEKQSLLTVNIKKMIVEYDLHQNNDSLFRNITLIISQTLEKPNGILLGLREINICWKDEIGRDDIQYAESSPYPFARGTVPEPERTFFEKIAEPVIFISTAIITIALLFSVRSG
jgi:hypothetical protein